MARVHRFEVWPRASVGDARGEAVRREAARLGVRVECVRTARVYLVRAGLTEEQVERVAGALLTNPVVDDTRRGAAPLERGWLSVEVLPLPGVMDPAGQTVEEAVRELTGVREVRCVSGMRYDFRGVTREEADGLAGRLLFNPAIQACHTSAYQPEDFPRAREADQTVRYVELRGLDDAGLGRLSREGHLFLSVEEMRAIRAEYLRLRREPTDVELETIAQTWSEHCVHKTLKSRIVYREAPGTGERGSGSGAGAGARSLVPALRGRAGHTQNADGSVTIDNLLKSTVAAATFELIGEGVDWTLSVFKDNSGVIRFDERHAVCIKVETHNHPSAIEPYGGAATGVGGCIRDVIATGLGAQPIANTDVFCAAYPDDWVEGRAARHQGAGASSVFDAGSLSRREGAPYELPRGVIHPRQVLTRVVDGVRDYGNRMGIPTVNGAVYFDNRYVGNPLVFCGCVGVMRSDMVHGGARAGDRIIAIGGRTGRDGIHGATFSSAELTDTHADEFSHAVQIGNAIEQKRALDAIMRARDAGGGPLYHGLTDCGAGGFSSAVGEMGSTLGAEVHLERAPLKYAGLRYDEVWISESQERFVLAVPPEHVPALQRICDEEGVLLADLGHFGTAGEELVLKHEGREVGRLSMRFLHDGIPMPTREAVWVGTGACRRGAGTPGSWSAPVGDRCHQDGDIRARLLSLLAHPNIASKRWIVRQYDHEVRGNTVVKPLVGPGGIGPGDATVIQPVAGSKQGLAIACGMAVALGDVENGGDPYEMALVAVDECVRNLVCVGADPDRIAILDNFCWPSCAKAENLASLVRAAEGCYDAAKAYRTPFVSGKDSLNNQLRLQDGRVIEIPATLLITGMGIVADVRRCVTMDMKPGRSHVYVVGDLAALLQGDAGGAESGDRLSRRVRTARHVAGAIAQGWIDAAHDCSEGGVLTALAEMLIGAEGRGERVGCRVWGARGGLDALAGAGFVEAAGSYIVQVRNPAGQHEFEQAMRDTPWFLLGSTDDSGVLSFAEGQGGVPLHDVSVSDLRRAFLGTLDW